MCSFCVFINYLFCNFSQPFPSLSFPPPFSSTTRPNPRLHFHQQLLRIPASFIIDNSSESPPPILINNSPESPHPLSSTTRPNPRPLDETKDPAIFIQDFGALAYKMFSWSVQTFLERRWKRRRGKKKKVFRPLRRFISLSVREFFEGFIKWVPFLNFWFAFFALDGGGWSLYVGSTCVCMFVCLRVCVNDSCLYENSVYFNQCISNWICIHLFSHTIILPYV